MALSATADAWCASMLPRVSRTFALCIRFLPDDIRRPVLLSYLLCRIADTIEDATALPSSLKQDLLADLALALGPTRTDVSSIATAFAGLEGADHELARHTGLVLGIYREEPPLVQEVVTPWIQEMCRGMSCFAGERDRTLATEDDLDRYCYYVAGTVGHLLTGLFVRLRAAAFAGRAQRLDGLAESFGAGLQLTNIIVDAGEDRRRGVSFVPEDLCRREGITPDRLLAREERFRARAVVRHLVRKARGHLADAVEYCELMPKSEPQIRIFCLLPVLLALRTLREVELAPDFPTTGQRIKIGRAAVYRTVAAARLCTSSNHLVRYYAQHVGTAY